MVGLVIGRHWLGDGFKSRQQRTSPYTHVFLMFFHILRWRGTDRTVPQTSSLGFQSETFASTCRDKIMTGIRNVGNRMNDRQFTMLYDGQKERHIRGLARLFAQQAETAVNRAGFTVRTIAYVSRQTKTSASRFCDISFSRVSFRMGVTWTADVVSGSSVLQYRFTWTKWMATRVSANVTYQIRALSLCADAILAGLRGNWRSEGISSKGPCSVAPTSP